MGQCIFVVFCRRISSVISTSSFWMPILAFTPSQDQIV